MRTNTIDFLEVERLHQRELQRRRVMFEKRSKKLMWVMMVVLVMVFIFL